MMIDENDELVIVNIFSIFLFIPKVFWSTGKSAFTEEGGGGGGGGETEILFFCCPEYKCSIVKGGLKIKSEMGREQFEPKREKEEIPLPSDCLQDCIKDGAFPTLRDTGTAGFFLALCP